MARGRMLARTAGVDARLAQLSDPALALYLLTIPHLDRDGLCDGRPPVVWGQAAPLRAAWQLIAGALILEWIDVGLVISYGTEREPVLYFRGFRRHQEGMRYEREVASCFPPPPGMIRCPQHGLIADAEALAHLECKSRDQSQKARREAANLGNLNQIPDLGRTESGLSPGEDQDQAVVVVHRSSVSSSRSGPKGGSGGKTDAEPLPTSIEAALDEFTDGDLIGLVDEWGELTGVAYEHSHWSALWVGLEREGLLTLLCILHYVHARQDGMDLKSPAAFVQSRMKADIRPRLRPGELAELRRMARAALDGQDF